MLYNFLGFIQGRVIPESHDPPTVNLHAHEIDNVRADRMLSSKLESREMPVAQLEP